MSDEIRVVATAGHVDHGKSTLVRALTGTDPDRWAEEKERGLTIDLGFAWARLPSGRIASFVDVPGHVRFIKNMLAGVGGVDACLLVVDAGEGWKPQSEEHLRILDVLGHRHGLVALTKVATVDDERADLVALEVTDHLAGTFLEDAEIVPVDALTGRGLDTLRAALDHLLDTTPPAPDRGRPRVWVDRSFSARGSGTVVTGTLTGGRVAVDDELAVLPAGTPVRVRSLQTHGSPVDVAVPGTRVAVNVVGAARADITRGDALVHVYQWHLTRTADASLAVLDGLEHEVSRRGAYQAFIGSGHHPVRVRVLGGDAIAPGGSGFVRLHLPVALPLAPGDRFVLRETGREETVGGGEVLDVDPTLPAAQARPSRSVERVVAERGWVEIDALDRLTGGAEVPSALPVVSRWVVDPAVLAEALRAMADRLVTAGDRGIDVAELDDRQRAVLDRVEGVWLEAGRARVASAADPLTDHPYLAALDASPFNPPPPDGVPRDELRALAQRGLVTERDGHWFSAAAVDAAAQRIAAMLAVQPDGVTVAEVRDALDTTRKHVLPLLGLLDATGVTRRRGDVRIAGPRLPE